MIGEPYEVAASEAELVEMARALIAPAAGEVAPRLLAPRALADRISPACADLVADALRHAWPALWRRGAVPGARPWAEAAPIGLAFGAPTMALLRWLVEAPLAAAASTLAPLGARELALGDQVVIYLALAAAEGTTAATAIALQPLVRAAPLAWLGFAHVLAGPVPAFDALATGAGALVVAALAPELARRWRAVEQDKRGARDPARLIAVGAAQDATLIGWLAACDRAQRRDLATWVIDAAAPQLARNVPPSPGKLDRSAPLSARAAARIAAGSLLRAVARWAAWDQQHRGVRFIDDDYPAAQRLLARFEPIGTAGAERAASWLADLSALPIG